MCIPFPSEHPLSVQIVDFRHPYFYFNKYLLRSIVDMEKITQILSELIAAFCQSIGILMLACLCGKEADNSLGTFFYHLHLLGVERTSSSCSSGMLGMSGYSRSCADLSSLTRGKVLGAKKVRAGQR